MVSVLWVSLLSRIYAGQVLQIFQCRTEKKHPSVSVAPCHNIKSAYIEIIPVQGEGVERVGHKKYLKRMSAEVVPNVAKDINRQIQEDEQIQIGKFKEMYAKTQPNKLLEPKDKEKSFKGSRGKQHITYKGMPI